MDHIVLIGYLAATLTTIAFLPQLLKTWRKRSAKDVSYAMLLIFLTGVFCWLIYGILIGSLPIIFANSITLVLNLLILILKMKFD
jgi:MtN3 and saliva related transmembrane protein